ncbi:minor tail protein [Arthrobacter phage DanielleIgnace]|nr:minor tail protein [Arthrobacter phage DanielleIgnace]
MNEGIELAVFNPLGTTMIDYVPRRWDPTFLEEMNRDGGGSFRIRADDSRLTDYPDFLLEGNMVRMTVDGGFPMWWEIAKKKNVIVSDGEYSGEWIEVSGPGVRSWMNHAVVYPEYGLVKNPGDRAFNFASKQGSWYNPAQWVAPTVKEYAWTGGANWAGLKEWPKNMSAQWIWNSSVTNAPKGDVYVRHEFSLQSTKKVRLYASADDIAVFLMDGARVLSITEWGAWTKVYTADIELSAGNHVLAARAVNTSVSKAGVVYALIDMSSEPKDDDAVTNAMRIIQSGTGGLINPYPATAPGWNVGQILNTLLDEAANRGVPSIAKISRTWTNTADSYGVPWPRTYDMVFNLGDSYSNVLTQLTDAYVDIWFEGMQLNMAPARGGDRSREAGAKDAVIFRKGLSVLGAESESSAEIANVAVVNTSDGLVERVGPSNSVSQFGRREAFLSAVNASESGTAGALINQLFTKYSMPRRTPTLDIIPTPGNVPWVDFYVGDWVLAPDDAGTSLTKRRIMSLSVTENSQTGEPVYAAEIDSIQQSSEERLARWLMAVENGTKNGGVSGTSSSSSGIAEIQQTGVGTGSPPIPSLPSVGNPSAPTNVLATADLYVDEVKVTRGKATVSWQYSGLDTSGRTLDAVRFEVAYRPTGSTQPWVVVNSDQTLNAVIAPLSPLKADLVTAASYTITVRAVGGNGRSSDWSQAIDLVMARDTTPPDRPYFPAGSVSTWLRTITVRWPGGTTDSVGTAQNPLPADFDHVNVYQNTSANVSGRTLVGRIDGDNGLWVTDKVTAGTALFYTLTAVDKSGNESAHSLVRQATPQANVDLTEITNQINAANLSIINLGASSILDKAILTAKLADNAVVMGKIDTAVQTEIAKGQSALDGLGVTNSNLSTLTTSVNGKNKIVRQTTAATGTGYVNGDRWEQWSSLAVGGKLLKTWRFDGSQWVQELIDPTYVPQIDIGAGTFGSLSGGRLVSNSVTATEILASRGANMHVDPEFADTTWWSTSAGNVTISSTGGKTGKGSALIAQTATQQGTYYASTTSTVDGPKRRARVVPGQAYKVGAWVYCTAQAPVNSISIYPRWFNDADGSNTLGSAVRYTVNGVAAVIPANTWTWVTGFTVCPAGANYTSLTLGLYSESTYSAGTTRWSDPSIQPGADATLIVQGSVFAEHVNAQSVAGAVGSFLTINVSQLNATSAAIDSAVVTKLWTDVVQSRKISTQMLEVTGQNMISNGFGEFGNNTNWSQWGWSSQAPANSGALGSFTLSSTITTDLYNNQAAIPVDGDTKYLFEFWIKADKANSKTYIEFMEDNGVNPTPQYAIADYQVLTTWQKVAVQVKTSTGQKTMRMRMFPNHPNGTVRDAIQYVAGLRFREAVSADLIVDGGVVAKHITASEEMWAKTLGAHKINVNEIDANSFTSDTGFVGSLRTNILTTDVIKAVMIDATGGITSRHTITGAKFQTTTAANSGVKYDSTGMSAWNTAGVKTFNVSATTGDVTIIGSFTTGSVTSGIVMDSTVWGGRPGIRLNTGTGVDFEPTIYAVDSTVAAGSGYAQGSLILMGSETTANSSGRTELQLLGGGAGFSLKNVYGAGAGRGLWMDVNGDFNLVGRDTTLGGVGWLRITGCARMSHTARDTHRYGYSATSAIAAGIINFTYPTPAPSGMLRPQISINAVAPSSAVTQNLTTSSFAVYYSGPANNQTTINYMSIWTEN